MKVGALVRFTVDYLNAGGYLGKPVGIVTRHVWAKHSNPDHQYYETARRLTKVRWLCDGKHSWEEGCDLEVASESRR